MMFKMCRRRYNRLKDDKSIVRIFEEKKRKEKKRKGKEKKGKERKGKERKQNKTKRPYIIKLG